MADRVSPHVDVRHISCNQSGRSGVRPRLIVIHATQGANVPGLGDLQGLGSWFDTPSAEVSSHVATDGEGNSARYVADAMKAWHCMSFNRVSLGIEQIGFAQQKSWPEPQLHETARWIARWSVVHGIPIQKGRVSTVQAQVLVPGVVRHSELGQAGGSHFDPDLHRGDYPMHEVLDLARAYRRRLV